MEIGLPWILEKKEERICLGKLAYFRVAFYVLPLYVHNMT